jgi:DNA-binding NtrC family response regulator
LIIDDHPLIGGLLEQQLTNMGYAPTLACRIGEARALIEAGDRFEVVVCECDPPDGDAAEFIDWIRSRHLHPGVVLTSATRPIKVPRTTFLPKPFSRAALDSAINSALSVRI